MKRFTAIFLIMILLVSSFGVLTASAGASIKGNSQVLAGKTYKYTGKASYSCGDLLGKIEGLGQVGAFNANASGLANESLSKSASISVTIPSGAQPGDKFTITLSGQYTDMTDRSKHTFEESKTITVVDKIVSSDSPKATKAPTEWDIAGENVAALQQGGTLTVDITADPKIPASVLTALKEKQGVMTVNCGGYTCTINGAGLANIPEDFIDLSLSLTKDEALSTALGGQDAYQLHFAHSGQLPGKFTYTFKAENNAPGDTLYLYYYYDQSGVVEGLQSAVVDENGNITFDVYHCSSYFLSSGAIVGTTGRDFSAESANSQALLDAQTANAELEAQLADSQKAYSELETQLEDSQPEAPESSEAPEMLAASAAGPVGQLFGVSYIALIAALAGAALVGVFLTMLVCKVGVFKKKEPDRTDII